jgi:hypothetical protein
MEGIKDEANIKTVSVKVTEDELKKLSRTRRRRTRRATESNTIDAVSIPIAKAIEIEKKPDVSVTPVAPTTVEPKSETPVKLPIQIGSKRSITRKNTATTAAAPGTPGAAANGTSVPKIIYSKKRVTETPSAAASRIFKSPLQVKSKNVLKVKPRKTRRTFSARKIAVTVGGPKLTHRYTSASKMRAELERHGVLKQNSKMPDEKLRRLYQDFRSL